MKKLAMWLVVPVVILMGCTNKAIPVAPEVTVPVIEVVPVVPEIQAPVVETTIDTNSTDTATTPAVETPAAQ